MAKRAQYDSVAIDTAGNALSGAVVTVYQADGVSLATIYGSKSGATTTNPITTNATGLVQFWAASGEYVLKWHDPTIPARFSDRTTYFEAVSGDTVGIAGSQIEDSGITAGKIAAGAVTLTKLGDGSVATAKLADDSVTKLKLAAQSVDSKALGIMPVFIGLTTGQTIATSTATPLDLANEVYDPLNTYDSTTKEFVAPIEGIYDIKCRVEWPANNTGRRELRLVPSITTDSDLNVTVQNVITTPDATQPCTQESSVVWWMNANDRVKPVLWQNRGGNFTLAGSLNQFSVYLVSGA